MKRFDLQRIPREWVYIVLVIAVSIPFFVTWRLPVFVSGATRGIYDATEKTHRAAPDKPVFIFSGWGPGTQGENKPQLHAFVRHMIRLRQPFVVFAAILDPLPPKMSEIVISEELELEKNRCASNGVPFNFEYGTHYANLGFKGIASPTVAPIIQGLESDLPGLIVNDLYGTPLPEIPIMSNITSLADFCMIASIGAGAEGEDIAGVFSPLHPDIPLAVATMALVCTKMYPYYDSGQFCGLMDGYTGASEYMTLLDPTAGSSRRTNALTMARLFIVLLIVIGNVGMLFERARKKRGLAIAPGPPETVDEKKWLNLAAAVFCIVFVVGLLAELTWSVSRGQGWSWHRLGAWVAAFCTIGILSFALGDNKLYRVLEHIIIGSASAYSLFFIIQTVLKPNLYDKLAAGNWWWLLVLIPSSLWFAVYFKRLVWMNKIVVGLLMGMTVGISFQKFINLNIPQVLESFKPLVTHTSEGVVVTVANWTNFAYVATMIFVLLYFVFCFRWKGAAARGVSKIGRMLMMVAFGALFGNTVATRMSWLIDRLDALAGWIKDMPLWGA